MPSTGCAPVFPWRRRIHAHSLLLTARPTSLPDRSLCRIGLARFFGIKYLEINRLFLRQHPEQRCVVLNGVGAEDGEAFHAAKLGDNPFYLLEKLPCIVLGRMLLQRF